MLDEGTERPPNYLATEMAADVAELCRCKNNLKLDEGSGTAAKSIRLKFAAALPETAALPDVADVGPTERPSSPRLEIGLSLLSDVLAAIKTDPQVCQNYSAAPETLATGKYQFLLQ